MHIIVIACMVSTSSLSLLRIFAGCMPRGNGDMLCAGDDHLRGVAMQGKYDGMTFWEQLDDGVQNTNNRKFLTLVPVVLFLLATHGTDYR